MHILLGSKYLLNFKKYGCMGLHTYLVNFVESQLSGRKGISTITHVDFSVTIIKEHRTLYSTNLECLFLDSLHLSAYIVSNSDWSRWVHMLFQVRKRLSEFGIYWDETSERVEYGSICVC